MRKDNIEKQIEQRTPIDFKFSDVSGDINYSRYAKSHKQSNGINIKLLFIGTSAFVAVATAIVIPVVLLNSNTNLNSVNGPGLNELEYSKIYYNPYQYQSEGLDILNFKEISKEQFDNIDYSFDNLDVAYENSDGSFKHLNNSEYTVEVGNEAKIDDGVHGVRNLKTVVIKDNNSNKKVKFAISVIHSNISSIKALPLVNEYAIGANFSKDDVEVNKITTAGKSYKSFAGEYNVDTSLVDFNHIGTYPVMVTALIKDSLVPLKTSYNVTVKYAEDIHMSGALLKKMSDEADSSSYILEADALIYPNEFIYEGESYPFVSKENRSNKIYFNYSGLNDSLIYDPMEKTVSYDNGETNLIWKYINEDIESNNFKKILSKNDLYFPLSESLIYLKDGLDENSYKYLTRYCDKKLFLTHNKDIEVNFGTDLSLVNQLYCE